AAGIIAYQPGGQPGYDNSQFFIRGVTTFGYNANPLILIDNIESSTTDLARLQVDDIESFSILKDAGSTSLYGSRGANGVLLITTKKGKMEKANVNFNFDNFISSPTKNIKIADPITYMKDYNEGQVTRDPRVIPQFDANKIYNTQQTLNHAAGSNPYVYPAVDWLGSLFKKYTSNRRANLSVRGGGKVAVYYISGSYNLNNGILKVSPVNNFNNNVRLQSSQLRSNIDVNLTKTTVLSLKIGGVFDDYNGPITSDPSGATDLYDRIMHTSPVLFPAYFQPDSANKFTHHVLFGNYSLGGNTNISFDNPYADLLKGYSQYTQSTINAQVDLNQKLDFIVSGLSFSGIFSLNRYSYYSASRQYNPFYYQVQNYNQVSNIYNLQLINNQTTGDIPTEYLDYSPGSKNVSSQAYIQGILNYNQTFGKHTLDVTYVASREQTINSQLNLQDNSALAASLPYRNINSSGKISYTYDRRYSLEGNFGYNGSERFNSNHRWGFFPSVGLAWNVSNESFWKDDLKNVISRFKIRGTYGITGNDALSAQRFFYLSNLTLDAGSPVSFGTANGYTHGGIQTLGYPNPDITWETSRQTNIGVDVTFFRSLSVSVDIYKQYRYNIYQTRVVPQALGLEAPVAANLGSANSKGLDIQIDYSKQISNDLSISGRANLTATQSRYGKYEEPDYPGEPWRKKAGTLINQTYGFVAERLFADNQEAANSPLQSFGGALPMGGDIKYRDINGDGVITQGDDEVPIGDPTVPQITYGFGASLRYKSFDINVFFQGNRKVSFFLDPTQISPYINGGENGSSGATQLLKSFADNHWSQNNQNLYAEYPRLGVTSDAIKNNLQSSTWWLRNGSFLRLKSLQFGYTIASNRLKKYHLNNCRFYADGLNMLLFSSFKEWDVEQGGNAFNYPIQRSFDIGVNININ
ncbi:SusC/RagA family TonB-linked outer membrane protein, partial [Arachidicoccus sp.]|uniref:SusC/RagA family TonB-linked outer membrane protein n=1 Tax=Arachidicoccus sp. TaxID=1872624 RepID=UPI003D1AC8EC